MTNQYMQGERQPTASLYCIHVIFLLMMLTVLEQENKMLHILNKTIHLLVTEMSSLSYLTKTPELYSFPSPTMIQRYLNSLSLALSPLSANSWNCTAFQALL